MARRYSDTEKAAIWAMRCQGMQPVAIRRALADPDQSPLGYTIAGADGKPIAKSTMRDILRELERKHGKPEAAIKPGEEDSAIDSIRREALGAILRNVRTLSAKQADGHLLSRLEVASLNASILAADGFEDRRRADRKRERQRALPRKPAELSSEPTLAQRLADQLAGTATD